MRTICKLLARNQIIWLQVRAKTCHNSTICKSEFIDALFSGLSSQFGLAEVILTACHDQFPSMRKYKSYLAVGVCFILFSLGLVMTTRAGIFYFQLFDSYSASFALMLLIILEITLVVYIYGGAAGAKTMRAALSGVDEYITDLRSMLGPPSSAIGRIFGPSGAYVRFVWRFVAPAEAIVSRRRVAAGCNSPRANLDHLRRPPALAIPHAADVRQGAAARAISKLGARLWLDAFAGPALHDPNLHSLQREQAARQEKSLRSCTLLRQCHPLQSLRELLRVQPKWPAYERLQKAARRGRRVAPTDSFSGSLPPPPPPIDGGAHPDVTVEPVQQSRL